MKLYVYDEHTVVEADPTYLRLVGSVEGGIDLIAVDRNGVRRAQGDLLFINADGTFELATSVGSDLGFQLDGPGGGVVIK